MAIFLFLSIFSAIAESRLLPAFWQAVDSWQTKAPLSREIQAIHHIWEREGIDPQWLRPRAKRSLKVQWGLPPAVHAQKWDAPIAIQATRLDVVESSDDVLKDDIYCYFFVTDGAITTGRVSSIYTGLESGESFHFSPDDRALFPLQGGWGVPQGGLIVDYGIVESDGRDIGKLQAITSVIIDLAIAVYAVAEPTTGQVAVQLRQEVKALADALISLEQDDRQAIGTIVLDKKTIETSLGDRNWGELRRSHHSEYFFDRWRYILSWRILTQ